MSYPGSYTFKLFHKGSRFISDKMCSKKGNWGFKEEAPDHTVEEETVDLS
jgi:hypothetical protein